MIMESFEGELMMKTNQKIVSLFFALLLLFVTACSSNNSSGSGDAASEGEKVTIKFAAWGGPEETQELQDLVDQVNETASNYKIELIPIPNDYYTKLQTMISGNTAPDIFYLSQEWVPSYASKNVLLDITEYANNDAGLDLGDYYDEPLRTSTYGDSLYGLPWISQPVVMYYNTAMFDEAGIPYPDNTWDWDKFREIAKELTKDTNDDGRLDQWGFTANGWPPADIWVKSMGGGFFTEDGEVVLDSPESIKGLEILHAILHEDGSVPQASTIEQQGLAEMFKAGRVGMFFGGASDDLDRIENLKVEATVVPQGTERATFNWIASVVASAKTKNPDITYEALRDMTEAIHNWKIVPPVKSLTDKIQEIEPRKPDSTVEAIKESMPYAKGVTGHEKQQELDSLIWDNLTGPLIQGNGTPEELAKKTAEKLREFIANNE